MNVKVRGKGSRKVGKKLGGVQRSVGEADRKAGQKSDMKVGGKKSVKLGRKASQELGIKANRQKPEGK